MYFIRTACLISDVAEVQADLMTKEAPRSLLGLLLPLILILFKDRQWPGGQSPFLQGKQPQEGVEHCVASRFKIINKRLFPSAFCNRTAQ